jgi:hypothetical protein
VELPSKNWPSAKKFVNSFVEYLLSYLLLKLKIKHKANSSLLSSGPKTKENGIPTPPKKKGWDRLGKDKPVR